MSYQDDPIDTGIWARIGPFVRDDRHLPLHELALYAASAKAVGELLATIGAKERSYTRFRIASAVIQEIDSGESWSANKRRLACGCHSVDFRQRLAGVYAAALLVTRGLRNSLSQGTAAADDGGARMQTGHGRPPSFTDKPASVRARRGMPNNPGGAGAGDTALRSQAGRA